MSGVRCVLDDPLSGADSEALPGGNTLIWSGELERMEPVHSLVKFTTKNTVDH
jgi:hypothetical protein